MANTQLQKTPTNTNSRQEFTFSFWLKRSKLSSEQCVWTTRLNSSNNTLFKFNANDTFTFKCNKSNADALVLTSNALFRDTSGWYNFVIAVDTTQSTDTNRVKIYINGVQETSFGTASYPSQNLSLEINESGNQECLIGSENNQNYFDGSMSYFAFVSETQELPTIFGETDSTTGEWKIKTTITPSVAWGTNGFLILVNGNSLTDQSTNSNNFALGGGTLTKTEDCPSNVFATMNPLSDNRRVSTTNLINYLKNGNTELNTYGANSEKGYFLSTIGVSKGKFYWEVQPYDGTEWGFGVAYNKMAFEQTTNTWWDMSSVLAIGFDKMGSGNYGLDGKSGESVNTGIASSGSHILGFALDMDNYGLYVHVNGTYMYSGNPESGSSRTGSILGQVSTGLGYLNSGDEVFPFIGDTGTSNFSRIRTNFGNGYFGTTAVSSAGTNASGNGIFEYNVPAGYTALSTKGLNL